MQISSRPTRSCSGLLIEISKPRSLNALDLEAFETLSRTLADAATNPAIAFVAIWAPTDVNPKAFCAGGDVRRLYEEYCASGSLDYGSRFFRAEYHVDQLIWKFPKPVIALTHGITMGGGIGLIRGAPIRVACDSSVWAMPEISIGLYPDVGSTYFLAKLPPAWAAFLALTGARLGLRDVLDLGLATHSCRQDTLPQLIAELDQLSLPEGISGEDLSSLLNRLIGRHQIEPPPRSWRKDWPLIEPVFQNIAGSNRSPHDMSAKLWSDARNTLANPACSPELRSALESLLSGSSLSVRIILNQLQQRLPLQAAFDWEYRVSMNCMERGDFFEGVRSRLVDKDFHKPGHPRWKYADPIDIPSDEIDRLVMQHSNNRSEN